MADDLDQQAVVGYGRSARLEGRPRGVGRDVEPFDGAGLNVLFDPSAHLRRGRDRPEPLHGRNRHAGAGNSQRQPGIVARKIEAAGERDANIRVAQLAGLEIDALLVGVDPQPQQDAVEDERVRIDRRRRGQHDGATGNLQPPNIAAFVRRVELREQGDAIAAGQHLERHHQRLARGIPIQADFGAIDRNSYQRIVEIDDHPLLHQDPAVERMRHAVGSDIGTDAPRQREIGLVEAFAQSHGEQHVLGRDLLRLDIDHAVPLRARRHGRAHLPGPLDAF